MSIITWAIDKRYEHKAIQAVRDEHNAWLRTAKLDTPYWTIKPIYPARPDLDWTYDIHGEYRFTKHTVTPFGINALAGPHGSNSWEAWYRNGPLTTVPQQTTASWEARHKPGHLAEMARMEAAVDRAAIAEIRRLYPASVKALVNA